MFGLLVLVGLFVALTPGVLFRLKGSKKMSAAMHAVLFGVVVYLVSMYGPGYGLSFEGFQAGPSPCPGGTTFSNGKCLLKGSCVTGGTLVGGNCVLRPPTCATGTLVDGQCINKPICPTFAKSGPDADGNCNIPLGCPQGFRLSGTTCLPNSGNTTMPDVSMAPTTGMPIASGLGRVEGPVHTSTNPWGATQPMNQPMNQPMPTIAPTIAPTGPPPQCPSTHTFTRNTGSNLANYGQNITTALCLSSNFPPVVPTCPFGKLVGNICVQ